MTAATSIQPPDLHSSHLLSLARLAMASQASSDGHWRWPTLDFTDPLERRFGDYELLGELGRGGMGVVYRAHQVSLNREVAIKFMAAGLADAFHVTRFVAEARAAARLVHPNIVPVFEVGSIDEIHYFSMPLIEGTSLEALTQERRLPPGELMPLLLRVCEAVDYAHRLGLLHLDLKPANILIDARGEPLIADFGLARTMDTNGGVDAQEVSGTPAFMAPEQVLIKQYRLTPATDLYALGALLYRCLTGTSPHGEGSSEELIRRALAGRIKRVREVAPAVPRDLAAVCEKCLELEPRDRYPSVRALIDDLRRIESGQPVSVRRLGFFERGQRWLRREPKLAAAMALALASLAIGSVTTFAQWRESEAARSVAVQERDAANAARSAESLQRERAAQAAALGARLFARGSERGNSADFAADLARWLQQRVPGDASRQAQILIDFADALSADGASDRVTDLLYGVVQTKGAEFEPRLIERLARDASAEQLVRAHLLAIRGLNLGAPHLRQVLDIAIAKDADNIVAWYLTASMCSYKDECRRLEAAENLVRLDGDNGYAWLLLATARDGQAAQEALHQAAQKTRFDDYFVRTFETNASAMEVHMATESGKDRGSSYVKGETERQYVAKIMALAMPLLPPLGKMCNPKNVPAGADALREDCLAIGKRLAHDATREFNNLAGIGIVRRLSAGTPLAAEMRELLLRHIYLRESEFALPIPEYFGFPYEQLLQAMREGGELAVSERKLAYFGHPTHPPKGWMPKNPEDLLLPEERAAKP